MEAGGSGWKERTFETAKKIMIFYYVNTRLSVDLW